nr:hypothetical protein [Paraburkholderia sp. J12]
MRNGANEITDRAIQREAASYGVRFAQAGVCEARHPLWRRLTARLMSVVMYFAPAVLLADQTAHAAPIVDPHAPITFQPTLTQSGGGVPVINIPAPNAQGLSVSQFQSLSAGSEGLIFNNSLVAGTSLTGGAVGANPNLSGRTASTILAEVTSTGSQYVSVIAGPLLVLGRLACLQGCPYLNRCRSEGANEPPDMDSVCRYRDLHLCCSEFR